MDDADLSGARISLFAEFCFY